MKPNYENLGLSSPMSAEMRKLVEKQLIQDLNFYGLNQSNLNFDWSKSCIEGHDSYFLNSSVENYSGITVFDSQENCVAEGWMEYVNESEYKNDGKFFIAFWDFVRIWENNQIKFEKDKPGIPEHIIEILPENLKTHFTKK